MWGEKRGMWKKEERGEKEPVAEVDVRNAAAASNMYKKERGELPAVSTCTQ